MLKFSLQRARSANLLRPQIFALKYSTTATESSSQNRKPSRVPLLVGGKFIESQAAESIDVINPATQEVVSQVPFTTSEEFKAAVTAAKQAFPSWRNTPITARQRIMLKLQELIRRDIDKLALNITTEQGKTLKDAQGDVFRGLEVVEHVCGMATLQMGEYVSNVANGIDTFSIREPLGVCAGICPFNFPAMIPLWMFPVAVTCGNTFILKPSEKDPGASILLAELAKEAGLPDGVLNIVHGTNDTVNAIYDTSPDCIQSRTFWRHRDEDAAFSQMTDLLTVLPHFDPRPYTHVLPSLEKALISCSDLLTLDAVHVAKRAQLPPSEVRKLADAVVQALSHTPLDANPSPHPGDLQVPGETPAIPSVESGNSLKHQWIVSTLDDRLDIALNGGIHSGYLTEITGESAAGKTQFLLTLLLAAQLDVKDGTPRNALYISTEAQLQTTRLNQILETHPKLVDLPPDQKPTLARIQSTHVHDLEAQEHILQYQVPVAISRFNVGLIVVDSIAANYRAEFEKGGRPSHSLAKRSAQVTRLATHLRDLARHHNIAVVVANQVADRFESQSMLAPLSQQQTQTPRPVSPSQTSLTQAPNMTVPLMQYEAFLSTSYPLALDHQQRFFTGWGDDPSPHHNATLKTPSLGLTWTNQLATRIALVRMPIYEDRAYQPGEDKSIAGWQRTMKVVYSAWSGAGETEYEIWKGGVRAVRDVSNEAV